MNICRQLFVYTILFSYPLSIQAEQKPDQIVQPQIVTKQKKAIVVGATSGMGRQVAKLLAQNGYTVGLVGRRISLLESLQTEIASKTIIKQLDVTSINAREQLTDFIHELGGLDLIVISISASNDYIADPTQELINNQKTLATDLMGFWTMADTALSYFIAQGSGHLVGISSTSGLKGEAASPVYSGAKAFISRYLEGERNRMIQKNIPIYITDIIPGWVEIEAVDIHTIPAAYWVATTQEAAQQIYTAISKHKKVAYITKRFALIALLYHIVPDCIYNAHPF